MSALGSPSPLFLASAAAADTAANITKSVRFNNDDSAYLNRSATDSGGNVYKYTVSWWMKIGSIGTDKTIVSFATNNAVNGWTKIHLRTDNRLSIFGDSTGTALSIRPTMLFRDPSAWYHCVVSLDTTESTYSNQAKFYINGVEQTDFTGTTAFAQNTSLSIGEATTHHVGVEPNSLGSLRNYFDGYIADLHVVEGQVKEATDFGAFDDNGVWQAANYTGTYGNNGYHLFDFANESGIGDDSSGNDNDFTANNLSSSNGTIASPTRFDWQTADSGWSLSDSDYTATNTTSGYRQVYSEALGSSTTYHFVLSEKPGDNNGGWFFSSNTSVNNTHPDELSGDALGLRTGESGIGTGGSFSTANGVSGGQNAITGFSDITTSSGSFHHSEWVINMTARKVWVRSFGSSSWIKGGDPTNSSSTPSFSLPTGTIHFGYVAYSSNETQAKLVTSVASVRLGNDILFDVPLNGTQSDTGAGGEVSGNYCTWNPLEKHSSITLANGNLDASSIPSSAWLGATFAMTSGKWYYEVTTTAGQYLMLGVADYDVAQSNNKEYTNTGTYYYYGSNGQLRVNGANTAFPDSTTYTYSDDDVIGIAFDCDNGTVNFYLNGSKVGGSSNSITGLTGKRLGPALSAGSGSQSCIANFGRISFTYNAPSGYKALCTTNLPDATVPDGSTAFDAALWTGDGTNGQSVTGLGFSPDFLWVKARNQAINHAVFDTVRGTNPPKYLQPNSNSAEVSQTSGSLTVTAFNSDGFTFNDNTRTGANGYTYVGWAWDAGSSTVSNTDGTITSQVRANQTAGFSIVTYTGNGTNNATVGHGLNAAPDFVITKNRDNANYWAVYPSVLDGEHLRLNLTMGSEDEGNYWSSFSSSVMTLPGSGSSLNNVNNNGDDYVSYCWSSVAGFSKFGEYEGNGNADGTFVFLGFKPALIIVKGHDFASNWFIHDYKRPGYNQNTGPLRIAAESELTVTTYDMDFLSNGFKMRTSGGDANQNNKNFAYFAWAQNPFQANGGLAR